MRPRSEMLDPQQREATRLYESKQVAKRVQAMLRQKRTTESRYIETQPADFQCVRPMFDTSFRPMLGALSPLAIPAQRSAVTVTVHTNTMPTRAPAAVARMAAAFSVLLETSEEPKLVDLCLAGFKSAIRISSAYYMEIARNMFVSSLFKFTHLNNLREIRHKNIAIIKTLINVAHDDGDHLQARRQFIN